MRRTAAALVAALALAGPAAADRHPQLEASVQQRLDALGFRDVDAGRLTLSQLAALHLQLRSRTMAFGAGRFEAQQRVKAILRQE